ncbi:type II toxin-antitoxin system PemK/MazF family toxin [Candidatus Acetothermia bacterium]|jgi:mRNA interferase MazF|nr:type II toxin-antitoxin system PemK/MazF family toxin [Candidatus Acetothermia bacterium]
MTNYQPGDLLLIAFPYARGTQTKNRPALIILDTGNADVVVARVTTQMHQTLYDVTLTDWQGAGLLAPSVVRLHKLATLEKALVRHRLGSLQSADRQRVSTVLRQTFGTW